MSNLDRRVRGGLFIISAPSGAGKTSLTRAAAERLNAAGVPTAISVSYTTRDPRPGEEDGVHYHFVPAAEFEAMAGRGEFLEHAEVFGRRYGTGRVVTETLLAAGTHVLLDIDWQGGRQIRAKVPEAIGIFILPPSREELERRLRGRGQDSNEVIARRMSQARDEISHHAEYEQLIVNRDFEQALAELMDLIRSRGTGRARQQAPKALIQQLLA